jgi:hypothetical protein
MTLEKELEKGLQASKAYEAVKDRLDLMKDEIHKRWEDSATEDVDGRDQAYLMLKAVKQLEQSLKRDIDTAKLAKIQLEKENG